MKFICLGYYDEQLWSQKPEEESRSLMEECLAYDGELRRGGHFLGGEALQGARSAATLSWRNGGVTVMDGPYAETKEQLGGILILEARDLNHAIQLMSKHPGVRCGPFEIRPANEQINALITERTRQMHTDPEPEKEHRWLQKLVGEWTSEMEASMEPGQPPDTFRGTEVVRSLGGLWTVGEGESEMPGGDTGRTIMTLGYDPARKKFVGTFVGSMMTHLWVYEGSLDETERVLTLCAEGPDFSPENAGTGKLGRYRDVIEFIDDDHRTLSSFLQDASGNWNPFMTAHYHRKK